jgi:Cof subfamily protein (haloacid dehalogenase superfamily)
MPIKLIALDLDDTLFRADLSISDANKDAINAAIAHGAKVVLASGRNVDNMMRYARLLGLDGEGDYIICANGAQIVETATERRLYERRFGPELGREITRAVSERGFPWQVYEDGRIRASKLSSWTIEDSRLTSQPCVTIDDVESLLSGGQLKFVIPGEPERIEGLFAEMRGLFAGRAEVVTSKPYLLEFLPPGVDKGEALRLLAELLGIPMAEVLAIGDSRNDVGMIKAAGIGCAPANAIAEARGAARYTSHATNDEDAVAEIIERFVGR